jgi:RNA polymerase sigma factor (sigma-70 family)
LAGTDPEPEPRVASIEEAKAALSALTKADLVRLMEYAGFWAKSLGRKARGRKGDDLFQESVTAVLDGRRRWRPDKVSFAVFLAGVIKSITSHWREAYDEDEDEQLEADLIVEKEEGDSDSPLSRAASPVPGKERELVARAQVELLEELFEDDPEALVVMQALKEGMPPQEIQELLELSRTAWETIITRVRRKARRAFPEGGA